MPETLYVNKPGGVIVHLKDGSQKHLRYGEKVPHDELAEHQKPLISQHADGQQRSQSPDDIALAGHVKEAHRASVMSNLGQPNSSADVVPGDYAQLDEDGAIALVRALERYPEAQAQVVLHEQVNYGRQRVIDAATDQARESAENLLDQLHDQVLAQHHVAAEPQIGERAQPSKDSGGQSLGDLNKRQLEKLAKDHDLDASGTKDELVERLSEAGVGPDSSEDPGTPPNTPPPTS